MKLVVWGMKDLMHSFIIRKCLYKYDEIVVFVDNNPLFWGKSYHNIPIVMPEELRKIEFDRVIICAADETSIRRQLIEKLNVDKNKIQTIKEIENYYSESVINKYKESHDEEIQKTIAYYEKKGLSVFGQYSPEVEDYEVYRDSENHPYVIFEEKRIYFPDTYQQFFKRNGKEYIFDIMYEQKEGSPHLYIKDINDIPYGSVIVDAGTCEGNFAIRLVEHASKIYLIESDPVWVECLERTFRPFRNKVIISNKQLGRYDSKRTITLDLLVKSQRIDFLKMDVEGSEIDGLLGARKTLMENDVSCAICCYHKMNDEKNIRFILENLGYFTDVSAGYMFFWYDDDICDTLDLRRGVVYANK